MKIWKNLFGRGDKIHADEIIHGSKNDNAVLSTILNRVLWVKPDIYEGDCNDLNTGVVYVNDIADNRPGNYCFIITVIRSTFGAQLGLRITSDNVYYRRKNSGTWYEWRTI